MDTPGLHVLSNMLNLNRLWMPKTNNEAAGSPTSRSMMCAVRTATRCWDSSPVSVTPLEEDVGLWVGHLSNVSLPRKNTYDRTYRTSYSAQTAIFDVETHDHLMIVS